MSVLNNGTTWNETINLENSTSATLTLSTAGTFVDRDIVVTIKSNFGKMVEITGNGSTKSFTVTHNLNNLNVLVQVVDSNGVTVQTDSTRATVNTITVEFSENVPSGTKYKVLIIPVVVNN